MSFILIFIFSLTASATDCNNAPMPSDGRVSGAWWSQYSSWCSACGGTPYQDNTGGGCRPGPNWGGGSAASSGGSSSPGWIGSGLPMGDQIMLNFTNQVLQSGMQELFRQPTPEEREAERLRQEQLERERLAQEAERQRLLKERNDKLDAEAASTLGLLGEPKVAAVSDEELLKETPPKVRCSDLDKKISVYDEGVKRLDINIGKTRKMIKQAEDGKKNADRQAAELAAEVVAGQLTSRMEDFAKNHKTIEAMKAQLKALKGGKLADADTEKLEKWLDNGLKAGNGVMDAYEKAKTAKEFNFSDPKAGKFSQQMLSALSEFNSGFMADTGAWEMAGENLAAALGPAGPATFKATVLGIKLAANRGDKMISENDLNEQKYNLGNMMKTRAEMAQKAKDLKSSRAGCVE